MQQRQLERDLPGPPPSPPPSGQGILLLRLATPEGSRTLIFPRSAPTRRKKSKFLAVYILYLTCSNLDSFLFRTLAQRAAKRAKAAVIVIEDDPIVSAGGGSETTLTDPAIIPQSSPQRSPQRKFIVSFLLSGAHECFFLC